jgi:hypothetical protein
LYDAYKGKIGTDERSCFEDEDLCLGKLRCLGRNIFLCPFVQITGYQGLLTGSPAYIVCFRNLVWQHFMNSTEQVYMAVILYEFAGDTGYP